MEYFPQKTIFQARYHPKLWFYDKLYKDSALIEYFPHWQTNRLKLILRDFEEEHSMVIAHDSISYESDNFNKQNEEKAISLLISEINNFVEEGSFLRFGCRRFFLIKQKMSFDKLAEIINLKYFSRNFKDLFTNKIGDPLIAFTSPIKENNFRLILKPLKKKEIPNYIKYNIENHIAPNSVERVEKIKKTFDGYPEVSLFIDIDYYREEEKLNMKQLEMFWKNAKKDIFQITSDIVSNLFKEKV